MSRFRIALGRDSLGEEPRWASAFVFLFLVACGVILMLAAEMVRKEPQKQLITEFGVVLISVFGVSLIYEHVLAGMHFRRMYRHLEELIRGAQDNAAQCAALGIREIHAVRKSYESAHPMADLVRSCGPNTRIRIVGRSLIYSMQIWEEHLSTLIDNGVTLQLCFFDPAITSSPLRALSGYDPRETQMALDIFETVARPWIQATSPPGSLELRFHQVHLMDSFFEVIDENQHWAAWDLNFGRGTAQRRIFVVNGESPLGRNLSQGRYEVIWKDSKVFFSYP